MSIKLFIFDWSGTLSDDRKPVYEANMRLLEFYGKPKMTFEEWLPQTVRTPSEFLNKHGVFVNSDKLFALYRKYYHQLNNEGIIPTVYPGALKIMKTLQENNKKLTIISVHPEEKVLSEASRYRLVGFFDLIIGSVKDKIKAIQEMVKKNKVEQRETIYIGDTVYDIQSAKEAGIFSGAVGHGYHSSKRLRAEKPDFFWKDLQELLKFKL